MKKFFGGLAVCLSCLLVFAGCGVEGSNEVSGIKFVRDVFYVDQNVETFLDYKIYPSTAQSYVVTYDVHDNIDEVTHYSFDNGYITVTDPGFNSVRVEIRLNDFVDECEVRLQKYPTSIGFFDESNEVMTSDTIYGGLSYKLDLKGTFKEGQDNVERLVENGEFVYKITSSNPNVIAIEDESRLMVRSTGRRGYSDITVSVCNGQGEERSNLKATIRLNVVDSINEVFANIGNNIIHDGDNLVLSASVDDKFEIKARYFDSQGFLIELEGYDVYLSNDNLEIVSEEGKIFAQVKSAGKVNLTIQSRGVDSGGLPVKIKVSIEVRILG